MNSVSISNFKRDSLRLFTVDKECDDFYELMTLSHNLRTDLYHDIQFSEGTQNYLLDFFESTVIPGCMPSRRLHLFFVVASIILWKHRDNAFLNSWFWEECFQFHPEFGVFMREGVYGESTRRCVERIKSGEDPERIEWRFHYIASIMDRKSQTQFRDDIVSLAGCFPLPVKTTNVLFQETNVSVPWFRPVRFFQTWLAKERCMDRFCYYATKFEAREWNEKKESEKVSTDEEDPCVVCLTSKPKWAHVPSENHKKVKTIFCDSCLLEAQQRGKGACPVCGDVPENWHRL